MSRTVRRRLDALGHRLRLSDPHPEMPADYVLNPRALDAVDEAIARLEARAAAGEVGAARKLARVRELLATAERRRAEAEA